MGSKLQRLAAVIILFMGITAVAVSANAQQGGRNVDSESPVEGVSFRFIESNGLRMRIAEAGEGPLILLAQDRKSVV